MREEHFLHREPDVAMKTPDWEIRREIGPGYFRTYAHGYWRDPFVVHVLGHTLIGKRALRRRWEKHTSGGRST